LGIVQAKAHRQVAEVALLVLPSGVLVQQLEHLEDKRGQPKIICREKSYL